MKKKSSLIILLIAAIVLVMGGGVVTAYAKFDVFKSPKTIYLEAERKMIRDLEKTISKEIEQAKSAYLPYLEETQQMTLEISDFKITSDELAEDDAIAGLLDFIETWELAIHSTTDPVKNQSEVEYAFSVDGEHFASLDYVMEETRIAFRIKEILDKYMVLDLQSDKLRNDLGLDVLPERVVTAQDVMDALRISKDEIKPILREYGKIYADELKDSQFSLNKDGTFKKGKTEIKARELTVTFTEEEVLNLLDKWLAHMEEDEALIDLLYEKYEAIAQLVKDSGEHISVVSKAKFKDNFTTGIKEFRDALETSDSEVTIQFVLYIDGSDRVLGRNIMMKSEEDRIFIELAKWTDDEKTEHGLFSLETEGNDSITGKHSSNVKVEYTWQEETGKGSFLLSGHTVEFEDWETGFEFAADFSIKDQDGKTHSKMDFKIRARDAWDDALQDVARISIDGTSEKNEKERSEDVVLDVALTIAGDSYEPDLGVSFKWRMKQQFGGEVELPTYTDKNSIDLANLDDQNMFQLWMEVEESVSRFMEEKADILGQFMTVFARFSNDPYSDVWYDDSYDEDWYEDWYSDDLYLDDYGYEYDWDDDFWGDDFWTDDFDEDVDMSWLEEFDSEQFEADFQELEMLFREEFGL